MEKFRIHLHQHPEIPFADDEGTHLTAEEIHEGAVSDLYTHCFRNDLSQVWAYMWNCWYSPQQWPLWARSAYPAIPRLKATMITESTWRVIKHQDLALFNRPRLDLVMHVMIKHLLPRVRYNLATIMGQRRRGRGSTLAEWQKDFRTAWLDMSRPDDIRNVARELEWLYKPVKTKGRAERLAQIRAEVDRPAGSYQTDIKRWTCSCPAYLISRFLTCKHIVRLVNEHIRLDPKSNLEFFAALRRHHYPPFYHIPGVHQEATSTTHEPAPRVPQRILRTLDTPEVLITEQGDTDGGDQVHHQILIPDRDAPDDFGEADSSSVVESNYMLESSEAGGGESDNDNNVNVEGDSEDHVNDRGSVLTEADGSTDESRVRFVQHLLV